MVTLIENSVNSGELSMETILSEALEFSKDYWVHPDGFVISTKGKHPKILKEAKGVYKRHYSFIVISHLEGLPNIAIQKLTGLSRSQVFKINSGKQWRHITESIERATTIPKGSTLQANGSGSAEQLK